MGNISANNAWNECLALNTESSNSDKLADTNHDGTHALIANPEWMTIARSIEDEGSNWVSGVLNRGWSADSWIHDHVAPQTDSTCLYSSAKDTCAATGDHKFKRTHTLKNGEVIWDFSGNVNEWTDWSASDSSFTLGPICLDKGTEQFQSVSCVGLDDASFMPFNAAHTSAQNIGMFKGGSGGAAARGGYARFGSNSGVYTLYLEDDAASSPFWGTGFRCVFRP